MGEAHPLLDLQALDSHADELRARRTGLPERAPLAACEAELAAVDELRRAADARRDVLRREERRIETGVADFRAKASDVEARLYSGTVKVVKELEALQHELSEHRRRQAEQEEAELALMEQEEALAGELAQLAAQSAALDTRRAELCVAIAAGEAAIDAELGRILEARAAAIAGFEPAFLKRYETLRAAPQIRGRAVARFADGNCGGCRTALPIALASRFQSEPVGSTSACPRCGRILVR